MKLLHPLTCEEYDPLTAPLIRTGGSTGKIGFFGMTRNGGSKMHKGIDILASPGDPVFASHSGTVKRAGEQSGGEGYGQRLYIRSDTNEVETLYAHLSLESVVVNQKIRRGHLIGFVGRSGNLSPSDETHIHWEVRENWEGDFVAIDPLIAFDKNYEE